MRPLSAAVILLMSAHGAAAGQREALFDRLGRLDANSSLTAYMYLECAEAATKDAASQDKVSPSRIMADWAARQGMARCASRGRALVASVGWSETAMLKVIVHRASIEAALNVRDPRPLAICAVEWHGCSMKLPPENR